MKIQKPKISDKLKDFFLQSLLIIFSVILALFLNELRTNQKIAADTREAMGNIELELQSNAASIRQVKDYHKANVGRVDSILQLLQQDQAMQNVPFYGLLRAILPHGINNPNLQSSAWNSMSASGLLIQMEYQILYALTKLYKLQDEGVESTWKLIANMLMSGEVLDDTKKHNNLIRLKMGFHELHQQEIFLLESIEKTLAEISAKSS